MKRWHRSERGSRCSQIVSLDIVERCATVIYQMPLGTKSNGACSTVLAAHSGRGMPRPAESPAELPKPSRCRRAPHCGAPVTKPCPILRPSPTAGWSGILISTIPIFRKSRRTLPIIFRPFFRSARPSTRPANASLKPSRWPMKYSVVSVTLRRYDLAGGTT